MTRVHWGRSWSGTEIEDKCPCRKALCGLVDSGGVVIECDQHWWSYAKTTGQGHMEWQCPSASNENANPKESNDE